MDLTETQRFWKAHLDAVNEFEGSAAEYARLHDLSVKKLYVYKSALRAKAVSSTTSSFVQVSTQTVSSQPGVQVMLANGVRLSLPDVNAPGLLERLARL